MSSRRLDPVAAPLLLWACAALVLHYVGYQGTTEVADVFQGRRDLREFASEARGTVRPSAATPFEVALEGPIPTPDETPPLVPVPPPEAKLVPPTPEAPKPPEPEKKNDEPKPEAPPQPPAPPAPTNDKRVAVRQHVDDKNQPDNPNARFAGDEANHVKEESVARITSHDRNDRDTSPGTSQGGPPEEPGNADKTRVADSEDKAGEKKRAPNEAPPEPPQPKPEPVAKAPAEKPGQNGVSGPRAPAQPAVQPPPNAEPPRPDVDSGPNGSYALNPRRAPVSEGSAKVATPTPPINLLPRLGGGPGPNGVNFNLSPGNAVAAVGVDELRRIKDADGERRRSAHRGSFKSPDLNRWRAQIENYVASVKTGNQTALNTARVPFATYLNGIHNRLHPLFADDYLASLDGLPGGHPLNRPDLSAALEVVVSKEDGSIVRMGVVKTSGVTAFDAAALESMQRASPFGKPPAAIISPDGNVYLHWEFHRNPIVACSTINARPFMLKGAPADVPGRPLPGPRVPSDPRERPPTREGLLRPPLAPPPKRGAG
ncbi:MAG TPA: TonB C-terminal domain-containing protein [Polyangiaceae bacterium]|nr:TonB C-terminal domain-containing protein [Polyangiaceae bacterium]